MIKTTEDMIKAAEDATKTAEKKAYCDAADAEALHIAKLAYPFEDITKALVVTATDEAILRDADLCVAAITKLMGGGHYGQGCAVARTLGYVVRTMGPDTAEQMAVATHDLFELMADAPHDKVPAKEKWALIRLMETSARCLLLAYRTAKAITVGLEMQEYRDANPDFVNHLAKHQASRQDRKSVV